MMASPKITETHTRTVSVCFSEKELQTILLNTACDLADFPLGTEGMTWKVTFEDETAGSPSYRTGTRACVEVMLDLTQLPVVAKEDRAP